MQPLQAEEEGGSSYGPSMRSNAEKQVSLVPLGGDNGRNLIGHNSAIVGTSSGIIVILVVRTKGGPTFPSSEINKDCNVTGRARGMQGESGNKNLAKTKLRS